MESSPITNAEQRQNKRLKLHDGTPEFRPRLLSDDGLNDVPTLRGQTPEFRPRRLGDDGLNDVPTIDLGGYGLSEMQAVVAAASNVERLCYIEYPELSELLSNSDELQKLTPTEIENLANNWELIVRTEHKILSVYNPQLRRLVRHINALIQLNKAMIDPTSRIGQIATQMSAYDKQLLAWKNLDLYEVLTNMPEYNKDDDLNSNLKMPTAYNHFVDWLTFEDKQKIHRIRLRERNWQQLAPMYAPISAKTWHCDFFANNPVMLQSGQTLLDQLEKDSFAVVIDSQQQSSPQFTSSLTPHTVVVAATCHGEVRCVDTTAENLPMYTVPAGKTVSIVSVATPGCIEINTHTNELFKWIRGLVSFYNIHNLFIDPRRLSDQLKDAVIEKKQFFRQAGMDKKVGHINPVKLARYLTRWTEPRVLYFNEGDRCIDKSYYYFKERTSQLIKFNLKGWDQELMPPNKLMTTDPAYRLSEMCNQLFLSENCKNIVLFDWSCSIIKNTSDENFSDEIADEFGDTALLYRFNGGKL